MHPSLHFKEMGPKVWSVRLNRDYRALARRDGQTYYWFWIGHHQDYERLLRRR